MTNSALSIQAVLLPGPGTESCPGGGEVQQAATAQALAALGVEVFRSFPGWEHLDGTRCVLHLFGSHREFLPLVRQAKQQGIPVVLSPVAWFDLAARWGESGPWLRRLQGTVALAVRQAGLRWPSWRKRLYQAVDHLLPNSQAEAQQLVRLFGLSRQRITVVPNGTWPRFAHAPWLARKSTHPVLSSLRGFVLCPGRIEPRKNQLELIRAMRGSGLELVILGQVVPGHEHYLWRCRQEADEQVHFVPRVPFGSADHMAAYAHCGCVVLPSWFETPGLAALEAGASGVPLVLTARGATREYFGSLAQYVDPVRPQQWPAAIRQALTQGRSHALAQRVLEHFTWLHAAQRTVNVYCQLLAARGLRFSGDLATKRPLEKKEDFPSSAAA